MPRDRGTAARQPPSSFSERSISADWIQCVVTARGVRRRPAGGRSRSATIRSAFHPTRLETRTKESNMCASHGVLRNPKAQ